MTKTNNKEIQNILAADTSKSKKMIALYDLGLEIKDIATLMETRYNFVYNVVSNYTNTHGLTIRTKKAGDGKKDVIVTLHKAGKTNKEIAAELKTNYNYVYKVISDYKKLKEA